ncbi:glycosyl hydrolase family 25, partial [Lachnotalea glycerini]
QLNKVQRTAICKAFCNRIEELGYQSGVYASTSWFKSNLDVSQLLDYYVWVAQYASTCTATHRTDMWQYTSKGSMAGISGNVDISHCYTNLGNTSSTNTLKTNETTIEADKSKVADIFKVKVTADSLRIRKGPSTSYAQVGSIRDKGVYTITKTSDNWGYLKSGAGWICLDYTKKV